MQPIKNDQAVAQMVSKQTTPLSNSHLAPQSAQGQQIPAGTDKSTANGAKSGNDIASKDILSGGATTPAKEAASRLAALQGGKESSELQVLTVRTSKAVEEQLESAQEKMNEIVDSYPPFLRGSEKRQQYLMSISSIRKQIEDMTFPPGKLDNPALDKASSNGAKKMWENLFQDVNIPALEASGPNEASDTQIRAASSAIGAMKSDLSGRRVALEQQMLQPSKISSPMAQYMSQAAAQGLTKTDLSLTANLTGALRSL
jgi:hypothetical protein